MILLEALTKDDIIKIFYNYFEEELYNLFKFIEKEERDFKKTYSVNIKLRLTLLLKFLSILKKYGIYKDFLVDEAETYIPTLLFVSFILDNKNLKNNFTKKDQEWFDKYNTLTSYDELKKWLKSAPNNLENVVLMKIYGDSPAAPIYEDDEVAIYEFTNPVIARKIGGDTKWCVSSPTSGPHYCKIYKAAGKDLFALIFKNSNKKYLLSIKPKPNKFSIEKEYGENFKNIETLSKKEAKNIVNEFWKVYDDENDLKKSAIINDLYSFINQVSAINKKTFVSDIIDEMFRSSKKFEREIIKIFTNDSYSHIRFIDALHILQSVSINNVIKSKYNINRNNILEMFDILNYDLDTTLLFDKRNFNMLSKDIMDKTISYI